MLRVFYVAGQAVPNGFDALYEVQMDRTEAVASAVSVHCTADVLLQVLVIGTLVSEVWC